MSTERQAMKSLDKLLDELAACVDTPETSCLSFPPDARLSPELNALEVRAIFERSWLCAGCEEYAPAPGDYCTTLAYHRASAWEHVRPG